MKSLFEGSILYRITSSIINKTREAYRKSVLFKVWTTIKMWYSHSLINSSIVNYLERKPNAKRSVTYRLLSFIGRSIDIPVGKFSSFIFKQLETSRVVGFCKAAKCRYKSKPLPTSVVFFIPLIAGYSLVTTIRGSWSDVKLVYILMLCIICIACFAGVDRWKAWIRNSIIYKLCHYIWE